MPMAPPTHRPNRAALEAARKEADAARGTARQRGYDAAWEKLRAAHLAQHPVCEAVLDDGQVCGSADRPNVDHRQPVRFAPERRLDPTNLRTLCHRCHSRRTAREQSRLGRRVGGV